MIEAADQTFYLTQSQYTETWPTSLSTDPIVPGTIGSVLRLAGPVGVESLMCNFSLSVAARTLVWADPSLRYMSLGMSVPGIHERVAGT